jgi:hypothetical protein
MDEQEFARRVSQMDQVQAGISDLSRIVAQFHRELRDHGLPRGLAADLAREMLRGMITQNGGPGAPRR